jgi:hypothetical protein
MRVWWHTKEAVALTQLTVLVSASNDEHVIETSLPEIEGDHIDLMVRVNQERHSLLTARSRQPIQPRDDLGRLEEHGRHHRARSARIERRDRAVDQRVGRAGRHVHDRDPFLSETIDLAPHAVKLAIGRDDSRPLQKRQRREPLRQQLVSVLSESDIVWGFAHQPGEAGADGGSLKGRPCPFLVDELGGVEPRVLLRFEADIGPRLVRVAGQQQTLGDAKS